MAEYERLYEEADRDPEGFWAKIAGELDWFRPWDKVLEWKAPWAKWFVGGRLNLSHNCLDRHLTRSEEHTSELQSHLNLVCRLLLEKKKHRAKTLQIDALSHT